MSSQQRLASALSSLMNWLRLLWSCKLDKVIMFHQSIEYESVVQVEHQASVLCFHLLELELELQQEFELYVVNLRSTAGGYVFLIILLYD